MAAVLHQLKAFSKKLLVTRLLSRSAKTMPMVIRQKKSWKHWTYSESTFSALMNMEPYNTFSTKKKGASIHFWEIKKETVISASLQLKSNQCVSFLEL